MCYPWEQISIVPMRMIHFIEATNKATTQNEVFLLLQKQLAMFGFDRICYSLLTDHPSLGQKAGHGILRNYPEDWMKYYTARGYENLDPVRSYVVTARNPFAWDDITELPCYSKKEKKVMYEAKDAKLYDGIGVPLYGPLGEVAGIGLASSAGKVMLAEHDMSFINLVSHQFYAAYAALHKRADFPTQAIRLTNREREILLWCARGKSYSVIGDILSLSEHGVEFHMRNIYLKLHVNNQVMAVVKAIHLGLITP